MMITPRALKRVFVGSERSATRDSEQSERAESRIIQCHLRAVFFGVIAHLNDHSSKFGVAVP